MKKQLARWWHRHVLSCMFPPTWGRIEGEKWRCPGCDTDYELCTVSVPDPGRATFNYLAWCEISATSGRAENRR